MEMQDNEFDNLFRSKFDDFEVMPSSMVWKNIDAELDNGKSKKVAVMRFLSIAASVIVLVSAGVLFIPHKIKTTKPLLVKNDLYNNNTPKEPVVSKPSIVSSVTQIKSGVTTVKQFAVVHLATKNKAVITDQQKNKIAPKSEKVIVADQPELAATQTHEVLSSSGRTDTTKLLASEIVIKPMDKTDLAEKILPIADKQLASAPVKKHRIHGLGDLLNVAIAAVDKRKDKVIEFSNSDDDQSSITGINLGVIKIKRDN